MEKSKTQVHVNREWCKGCGICVHFCPEEVLELVDDGMAYCKYPEKCKDCALCELRCPDMAIELV